MTPEEKKEYQRQYYKNHREERIEASRQWKNANRDKLRAYNRKSSKRWYDSGRGLESVKKYQKSHPVETRASVLVQGYKKADKQKQRGECTLTTRWILENIFNSKCTYCGVSGWTVLGCDRIDNSKPHTPDNVVCSCWDCNNKRQQCKVSCEIFKMLLTPQYITITQNSIQ